MSVAPKKDRPVVLITGAGTGIGAACARLLAARGWNLLVNYRKSEAEARSLGAECEALGAETELCRGDVAVDADCRGMAEAAWQRFGRIDGLVSNAAITTPPTQALDQVKCEDFQKVFGVNVIGAFQISRACAPALARAPNGAIVIVSSDSALSGIGRAIPYTLSKGSLNTMTRSLAIALAPIRVNAVCPGWVDTRWQSGTQSAADHEKVRAAYGRQAPLGRHTKPEDVAEVIAWFLTGARMVTGTALLVDGGIHLVGEPPEYMAQTPAARSRPPEDD